MSEVILNKDNFAKEVLQASEPVLVDFWAEWCGPCRIVGPVVSEIAKDFEGKAKIGKLNVDEFPDLANTYHVMSIPNLKIFKGGKVVDEIVGAVPKSTLAEKITKHI